MNIACFGTNIRSPQVHVPLSLTATCQLCELSRKAGRNNYIWHYDEAEYVAFIGIDWADAKHDICLQVVVSEQSEFIIIPHKVERIDDWAQSLHQRFGSPIAVAVELTKGPIV